MENDMLKIESFFKDLSFIDHTHTYYVKDVKVKSSVSKLIKLFVADTDFNEIAIKTDLRDGLPTGTTAMLWDLNSKVSLAIGTRAHFFGEMYVFNKILKPINGYEKAIVKFWNELPSHLIPVKMELRMFHKDYLFAGTGDILLYNTITGKFIIADYKTNKNLFKNHNDKKMTGIFSHLLDMPLSHYKLQLSFYQLLFEQTGYEVEDRIVIWLKPDGEYEMYDTEDYTRELKEYLKNNKV